MDNFSAHELAVEMMDIEGTLTNTKVKWLPPNATSIHQPLDQGIIQNWKSYIKNQFVMFMAKTFDEGKDLSKEMHILRAIRWGISAWENDVTPATIQNCWARSQAIDFGSRPEPASNLWTESQQVVDEIRQGLYRMRKRGYITVVPNVQEYISPYIEKVQDDCPDDLVDEIVTQYTHIQEDDEEEDEPIIPPLLVTHEEAMSALHILHRYEEENKNGNLDFLRQLRKQEREISRCLLKSKQQIQLDHWVLDDNRSEL
jgi:hypothetical protein